MQKLLVFITLVFTFNSYASYNVLTETYIEFRHNGDLKREFLSPSKSRYNTRLATEIHRMIRSSDYVPVSNHQDVKRLIPTLFPEIAHIDSNLQSLLEESSAFQLALKNAVSHLACYHYRHQNKLQVAKDCGVEAKVGSANKKVEPLPFVITTTYTEQYNTSARDNNVRVKIRLVSSKDPQNIWFATRRLGYNYSVGRYDSNALLYTINVSVGYISSDGLPVLSDIDGREFAAFILLPPEKKIGNQANQDKAQQFALNNSYLFNFDIP